MPELLTLTDLTPRTVGPADRVDIVGRDLPVGHVGDALVVFRGDLHRPGEAPLVDRVIEVSDARVDRDRVTFDIDDGLLEQFTGTGDGAKHTTFRGTVEVRMPGASTSMPVVGSIKGEVVLDVVPRSASARSDELRDAKAVAAQAFFGWTLEPVGARATGLAVHEVRDDSPAARAGFKAGDILVAFEGVTALAPSDVLPSGLESALTASVLRGDEVVDLTIDARGFRGDIEAGLTGGVVVLATLLVLLLLFGTRAGAALSWLSHRLREEVTKHRVAGGSTVFALIRATVSDLRASRSATTEGLGALTPILVCVGVSISFASLPFVELQRRAELDLGILYLLSFTALLAMGLVTGGFGSARSFLGSRLRAIAEVVVCELPAACALGAVVVTTGSLRVRDVVFAQVGSGATLTETGSWPWAWNALKSPQLFLLFGLFFVTALVDGGDARSSRRAGEKGRSSLGSVAFFFAEWTHVFIMCALGTIAFLGGYAVPGVAANELYSSGWLKVLGGALFLLKCWGLSFVVLLVRASLPRIRPPVLLRLGLRVLIPACLVGLALTALTLRFPLVPAAERALGLVTMASVFATLALLFGHVRAAVRSARPDEGRLRTRVNPLL